MSDALSDEEFEALVLEHRRPSERQRRVAGSDRPNQLVNARRDESEYHQIRVLILIVAVGGQNGSLDGLTKLAKLDFLLRYPAFLAIVAEARGLSLNERVAPQPPERLAVESRMVRYKYGPWDDRYYAIIGALVGRGLVEYVPTRTKVSLRATPGGRALAETLAQEPEWQLIAERSAFLAKHFRKLSGNQLKNLIYTTLPEVVDRPHRTEI